MLMSMKVMMMMMMRCGWAGKSVTACFVRSHSVDNADEDDADEHDDGEDEADEHDGGGGDDDGNDNEDVWLGNQ